MAEKDGNHMFGLYTTSDDDRSDKWYENVKNWFKDPYISLFDDQARLDLGFDFSLGCAKDNVVHAVRDAKAGAKLMMTMGQVYATNEDFRTFTNYAMIRTTNVGFGVGPDTTTEQYELAKNIADAPIFDIGKSKDGVEDIMKAGKEAADMAKDAVDEDLEDIKVQVEPESQLNTDPDYDPT